MQKRIAPCQGAFYVATNLHCPLPQKKLYIRTTINYTYVQLQFIRTYNYHLYVRIIFFEVGGVLSWGNSRRGWDPIQKLWKGARGSQWRGRERKSSEWRDSERNSSERKGGERKGGERKGAFVMTQQAPAAEGERLSGLVVSAAKPKSQAWPCRGVLYWPLQSRVPSLPCPSALTSMYVSLPLL